MSAFNLDKLAQRTAERALDIVYEGKPLREWIRILKEQKPVKPDVNVDTWVCGNCAGVLERQQLLGDNVLLHEQFSYCPYCGRKVDWSE